MIGGPAPTPDELVESLFFEVLLPPDGYEYVADSDGQLLFPMFGSGQWRLQLRKKATGEKIPIFLEGAFITGLTKALHATQRALNQAVTHEIPDPVSKALQ